jgi:hypothetical protein
MTKAVRIALVGHCGPDAFMLRSALRSIAPEGDVVMVTSASACAAQVEHADLFLVNRVLDGDFASTSGQDLISQILADRPEACVMLVSNFADAQAEAESRGALPGFGKNTMRSDEAKARIVSAITRNQS